MLYIHWSKSNYSILWEEEPLLFVYQVQVPVVNLQLCDHLYLNPLKPEFTIVIFIHYKPRIAVAILDL